MAFYLPAERAHTGVVLLFVIDFLCHDITGTKFMVGKKEGLQERPKNRGNDTAIVGTCI